jgi:FixJ family two-component response regulator
MTGRQLVSVVDDDPSLRQSVKNLLSSVGIEVATFASAEAFLVSGELNDTGCLVVDFRLEGMSGLELIVRLSAGDRQIPIVMLTALGDPEVRQRCIAAGAQAFLTKPFRAYDLVDAVRTGLAKVSLP